MAGQGYRVKVTFELSSKDRNKSGKVLAFTPAHLGFRKLSFLLSIKCMPVLPGPRWQRLPHGFKASLVHLDRPAVSEGGG